MFVNRGQKGKFPFSAGVKAGKASGLQKSRRFEYASQSKGRRKASQNYNHQRMTTPQCRIKIPKGWSSDIRGGDEQKEC